MTRLQLLASIGVLATLGSSLQINVAGNARAANAQISTTAVPKMQAASPSRRVLLAAAIAAVAPVPAFAETMSPLTPSAMLTAGEWLNDIKAAKLGLAELKPLLEQNDDSGYEAVRINIRKAPLNGIRKACSKIIALLPDGAAKASKSKTYDKIKKGLEALDGGCRPEVTARGDLLGMLATLEADLGSFGEGLGVVAAPSPAE